MKWYQILDRMVKSDVLRYVNIGLYGPPGTGKSHWAFDRFKRVEQISLHRQMLPDELIGMQQLRANSGATETKFAPGPLVRAMTNGLPLVLDEINEHSPEMRSLLHSVCDDRVKARVWTPDGKEITPKDGYTVIATMNDPPSVIPPALRERFVWIYCPEPSPGVLAAIGDQGASRYVESQYKRYTSTEAYKSQPTARSFLQFCALKGALKNEDLAQLLWGNNGLDILNSMSLRKG